MTLTFSVYNKYMLPDGRKVSPVGTVMSWKWIGWRPKKVITGYKFKITGTKEVITLSPDDAAQVVRP